MTFSNSYFSFQWWVKFKSLPTDGNKMVFFSKWDYDIMQEGSYIGWIENNAGVYAVEFCVENDSQLEYNYCAQKNITTPEIGVWHNFEFLYWLTNHYAFLYQNGQMLGTAANLTITTLYDSYTPFTIGAETYDPFNGDGINYLDGYIDDFRIWVGSSPRQHWESVGTQLYGDETDLFAYWNMDGNGNDIVGNHNLYNNGLINFVPDIPFTSLDNIFYQENQGTRLSEINPFYFWITFFVFIGPWIILIMFVFWLLKILTSINPRSRL